MSSTTLPASVLPRPNIKLNLAASLACTTLLLAGCNSDDGPTPAAAATPAQTTQTAQASQPAQTPISSPPVVPTATIGDTCSCEAPSNTPLAALSGEAATRDCAP